MSRNRPGEMKKQSDTKKGEQYKKKFWKQNEVHTFGVSRKATVRCPKVCAVRKRCQEVRRQRKDGRTHLSALSPTGTASLETADFILSTQLPRVQHITQGFPMSLDHFSQCPTELLTKKLVISLSPSKVSFNCLPSGPNTVQCLFTESKTRHLCPSKPNSWDSLFPPLASADT